MEVPDAVLDKLKCENCESYLSRGPVLMLDNELSRCGRCSEPEEGGKRNKPYEELAQLMTFPCRYKDNGCEEKIRFEENKVHEEACAFRVYVCPIAESGKCEWSGIRDSLLEHCKTKHPDSVIENPGQFTHDITKSSLGNYLLFAYQVLFLVQTKVCTVTRKIYHSVRLLDDPRHVSNYSYDLDITNATGKVTKHGKVAPRGCLALQEDTSVAMDINGLLMILGGFSDTIFTLTVQFKEDNRENTSTTRASGLVQEFLVDCTKCKCQTRAVYYYRNWLCQACAPVKSPCENTKYGCRYEDIVFKTRKHEQLFCQFRKQCTICTVNLRNVTLEPHYTQSHADLTRKAGNIWSANLNDEVQWCFINSDLGKVICKYYLTNLNCYFQIYSPLASDQLCMYRCILKIHLFNNHLTIQSNRATTRYTDIPDWTLCIRRDDLNPYIVNNILLSIVFLKTKKLDQLRL